MTDPTRTMLAAVIDPDTAAQLRKSIELGMAWATRSHLPISPALRAIFTQANAVARGRHEPPDTGPWPDHTEPHDAERRAYRTSEVAAMTGVSPRTVQTWTDDGGLPSVKIGGIRLILPDDLDRFLQERRT